LIETDWDTGDIMSQPLRQYKFEVRINNNDHPDALFTEVSGLGGEIEFEEYKEGGVNDFVHKLPTMAKYSNLILKTGLTSNELFYEWFEKIAQGETDLRTVEINLLDLENNNSVLKSWTFYNAYPVKISQTDLNAQTNGIVIDTIELAHTGMILT